MCKCKSDRHKEIKYSINLEVSINNWCPFVKWMFFFSILQTECAPYVSITAPFKEAVLQ